MLDLAMEIADPATYGWKAHYLSRVAAARIAVPHALAIGYDEDVDLARLNPTTSYAVRSSGVGEDSTTNSFAGHFRTFLAVRGASAIRQAVAGVRRSAHGDMRMGVLIQRMVEKPIVSGAAFSLDPVTYDASVTTISWVYGLGAELMSGAHSGNDLLVHRDGSLQGASWPTAQSLLDQLVTAVNQLKELIGQPVEIEWTIADPDQLVVLQLRPVVLPPPAVVNLEAAAAFDNLPGPIRAHSKIALRAKAATLQVPMSRARAMVATIGIGLPSVGALIASDESAGRSVVLLHPTRVEGRIVREFTKDCGTDVEFFVRGCQRYAIRQYPEQSGAMEAVIETLKLGLKYGPLACVIEQEILHAYATGILKQTSDGYLAEIALGHFVPKGYVETSAFMVSRDLKLTYESRASQSKAYHFINGHVVVETPPYDQLTLTEGDLARLVTTLAPIMDSSPGVALEFGLVGIPGELHPYLIDVAEDSESCELLTTANLCRGVVSSGIAEGPVVDLREAAAQDDLNAHLYDNIRAERTASLDPAIYLARAASIDLLPVVRAAHPRSGFVFEQASLLAHLAVVLRERGIAAVTLSSVKVEKIVHQGGTVRIDTSGRQTITTSREVPEA